MKKIIVLITALLLPFLEHAQSLNPFVAQGIVTPAPLYDVASNGQGTLSFIVGNSGDNTMPYVVNQEMVLIITLSRGVPSTTNPVDAISGTFANYFDWQYDALSNSYQGLQNQMIPDALNGGVGTILIEYTVTSNSTESSPQNGFNVNITPPPYTNGINSLNDDQVSAYTWTIPHVEHHPDLNVANINETVNGNVSTNDVVPTGSSYGTPVPSSSNPVGATISMNPDGTYTFSAPTPGVYTYLVPVCVSGQTTNCPQEELTITIIDNSVSTNPPVANTDIASVIEGQSVVVNSLANDESGNNGGTLNPSSVTIATQPNNGTASVNTATGEITYTPANGFVGIDTIEYQVCDNEAIPNCATATQIITVLPVNAANTVSAADDYKTTIENTPTSGNVKSNDTDPQGNVLEVQAQSISTAEGTVEFNSDGSYLFTPATNFTGPVDYMYTVCDDATPQACTQATLHLLVKVAVILPISKLEFNAFEENCTAKLTWTTENELNINKYNIQRKTTQSDFQTIASVQSKGNSTQKQSYSYTDTEIQDGDYEYRLEIIDQDQKISYSKSFTVKIDCIHNGISLYPNPASSTVYIVIQSEMEDLYEIKMYDMSGKTVYSNAYEIKNEKKTISIPLQALANGMYNIVIKNAEKTEVIKFQKK
ncbi:MAG: Ig-like domain-containing protein [Chitinophagaceae bacterium]